MTNLKPLLNSRSKDYLLLSSFVLALFWGQVLISGCYTEDRPDYTVVDPATRDPYGGVRTSTAKPVAEVDLPNTHSFRYWEPIRDTPITWTIRSTGKTKAELIPGAKNTRLRISDVTGSTTVELVGTFKRPSGEIGTLEYPIMATDR